MSWKVVDRNVPAVDAGAAPVLTAAVREKIRSFFGRYRTRRAVLLPALHVVQDALGHVSWQAMVEIAEVLGLHPSEVIDTVSFYTHFWTKPRGKKVITVCRSVSCEILGGDRVLAALKDHLGIDEHETTPDGAYSLVTEACLAGCDHAPCLLINERLHKRVQPGDVAGLLADAENDRIGVPRSDVFDAPGSVGGGDDDGTGGGDAVSAVVGTTSDVDEMRDGD